MAELTSERHSRHSTNWFIDVYSGTKFGEWFDNILKLFIAFDSETPFLDIYAKEIITDICNN